MNGNNMNKNKNVSFTEHKNIFFFSFNLCLTGRGNYKQTSYLHPRAWREAPQKEKENETTTEKTMLADDATLCCVTL